MKSLIFFNLLNLYVAEHTVALPQGGLQNDKRIKEIIQLN